MNVWDLQTGVHFIVGKPGAGKSFLGVRRALRCVREEARPLFTNLPLRWKVVRQYLRIKEGEEYANLVFPLSEGHFRRFLTRAALMERERSHAKSAALAAERTFSETSFEKAFCERHGPHLIRETAPGSDDANWVLPTSVVLLDEPQHWFPANRPGVSRREPEPAELMTYATMVRHHIHNLICITQDEKQVTVTLRRLCYEIWRVSAAKEEHVVYGIRMGILGIGGILLRAWRPEDEESQDPTINRPLYVRLMFHKLPHHVWLFRLYDSHTHAGNARRLARVRNRTLVAAGLTTAGQSVKAVEAARERARVRMENRRMGRRLQRWGRFGMFGGVLVCAFSVGRGMSPQVQAAPVVGPAVAPLTWLEVDSYARDVVRIGSMRVRVGESCPNGVLLSVRARERMCVWMRDGLVFRQQHGPAAERVCTVAELAGLVRASMVRQPRPGSEPLGPTSEAGEVVPPEGERGVD